jgi:predicted transcriptional regulator
MQETIQIRLPNQLKVVLQEYAEKRGFSMSVVVRMALWKFIDTDPIQPAQYRYVDTPLRDEVLR